MKSGNLRHLAPGLLALALLHVPASEARVYCCKDARGQQVCGDVLPAACADRGYRELNSQGATVRQVEAPMTEAQRAKRDAEAKKARDEDMVEFTSVAGLPARAVATPWLKAYLKIEDRLQAVVHAKNRCTKAFDCLAQCGLRDGLPGWGQFCIDNQLAAALRGDLKKGLFFRGVGELPFGSQIRSVRELMERLLTRSVALRAV